MAQESVTRVGLVTGKVKHDIVWIRQQLKTESRDTVRATLEGQYVYADILIESAACPGLIADKWTRTSTLMVIESTDHVRCTFPISVTQHLHPGYFKPGDRVQVIGVFDGFEVIGTRPPIILLEHCVPQPGHPAITIRD